MKKKIAYDIGKKNSSIIFTVSKKQYKIIYIISLLRLISIYFKAYAIFVVISKRAKAFTKEIKVTDARSKLDF